MSGPFVAVGFGWIPSPGALALVGPGAVPSAAPLGTVRVPRVVRRRESAGRAGAERFVVVNEAGRVVIPGAVGGPVGGWPRPVVERTVLLTLTPSAVASLAAGGATGRGGPVMVSAVTELRAGASVFDDGPGLRPSLWRTRPMGRAWRGGAATHAEAAAERSPAWWADRANRFVPRFSLYSLAELAAVAPSFSGLAWVEVSPSTGPAEWWASPPSPADTPDPWSSEIEGGPLSPGAVCFALFSLAPAV